MTPERERVPVPVFVNVPLVPVIVPEKFPVPLPVTVNAVVKIEMFPAPVRFEIVAAVVPTMLKVAPLATATLELDSIVPDPVSASTPAETVVVPV